MRRSLRSRLSRLRRAQNLAPGRFKVDKMAPDLGRHPKFARTRQFDIVMEPGEALFLPVGWWHHVTALSTSVSVSFMNFLWPNSFTFHDPHIGDR
jgi:ribosomal protein L16 Arg81 hydroxylase